MMMIRADFPSKRGADLMDLMGFPHLPLFQAEPSLARNCHLMHLMGLPRPGPKFIRLCSKQSRHLPETAI